MEHHADFYQVLNYFCRNTHDHLQVYSYILQLHPGL